MRVFFDTSALAKRYVEEMGSERYRGGTMNLEAVEREVAAWEPGDQDRLATYLTVLRLKRSPDHAQELTRRLDDREPAHWVSLDKVKALGEKQR